MASVNWLKMSDKNAIKALIRHCDKEERMKSEHSNMDINKNYTDMNMQLTKSYKSTCDEFDNIMKHCEESGKTRIRKDTVRAVSLNIPVPADLNEDKMKDWFNDCLGVISATCGGDLLNAYAHFDEISEYRGEDGKKHHSRPHMHVLMIPEVEDGKLLCKEYSSRKNIVKLNNAINDMSYNKYHVQFNTGEKKKGKSVEELKTESHMREIEEDLQRREFELANRESQIDREINKKVESVKESMQKNIDDLTVENTTLKNQNIELQNQVNVITSLLSKNAELEKENESLKEENKTLKEENEKLKESSVEKQKESVENLVDSVMSEDDELAKMLSEEMDKKEMNSPRKISRGQRSEDELSSVSGSKEYSFEDDYSY